MRNDRPRLRGSRTKNGRNNPHPYPELGNDSTPSVLTINDERSRLQSPQLDEYDFTQPALEPSYHATLHLFLSFRMAPTKTTRKNAPSKRKVTQPKGNKNAASKSKATQAKGKGNATSTAALQAAKKKNQLRKDTSLGMSNHELKNSSTTMSRHLLSIPRIPHCFGQYQYEHSS